MPKFFRRTIDLAKKLAFWNFDLCLLDLNFHSLFIEESLLVFFPYKVYSWKKMWNDQITHRLDIDEIGIDEGIFVFWWVNFFVEKLNKLVHFNK